MVYHCHSINSDDSPTHNLETKSIPKVSDVAWFPPNRVTQVSAVVKKSNELAEK